MFLQSTGLGGFKIAINDRKDGGFDSRVQLGGDSGGDRISHESGCFILIILYVLSIAEYDDSVL